jgi:hypothetical protein
MYFVSFKEIGFTFFDNILCFSNTEKQAVMKNGKASRYKYSFCSPKWEKKVFANAVLKKYSLDNCLKRKKVKIADIRSQFTVHSSLNLIQPGF